MNATAARSAVSSLLRYQSSSAAFSGSESRAATIPALPAEGSHAAEHRQRHLLVEHVLGEDMAALVRQHRLDLVLGKVEEQLVVDHDTGSGVPHRQRVGRSGHQKELGLLDAEGRADRRQQFVDVRNLVRAQPDRVGEQPGTVAAVRDHAAVLLRRGLEPRDLLQLLTGGEIKGMENVMGVEGRERHGSPSWCRPLRGRCPGIPPYVPDLSAIVA